MAILLISSCPVIEKLCDQPAEPCHGEGRNYQVAAFGLIGSKNFVPESFIAA